MSQSRTGAPPTPRKQRALARRRQKNTLDVKLFSFLSRWGVETRLALGCNEHKCKDDKAGVHATNTHNKRFFRFWYPYQEPGSYPGTAVSSTPRDRSRRTHTLNNGPESRIQDVLNHRRCLRRRQRKLRQPARDRTLPPRRHRTFPGRPAPPSCPRTHRWRCR